ncbi:glycoside hydrolase family 5 protein [Jaapia argillacea MUCL 33604]|uniref:mannan endo-1,4-beta-mannosidase n=1 Tax=Jaapia argillacea MUCL 33604 TaxID=933084 RepID=A0A067PN79_9AGAM|nr:glycoside hydrolase family 5 protein [Jaapia argillacea MUCL 33604]
MVNQRLALVALAGLFAPLTTASRAANFWRRQAASTTAYAPVPSKTPTITPVVPNTSPSYVDSFVKPYGDAFQLNGMPYYFAGANAYWLMNQTDDWVDSAFGNLSAQGIGVVRTWFFNDGWFHTINGTEQAFNDSPEGIGHLDYVVKRARDYGIKLIATLANNWPDYGGVHYYLHQTGYNYHSDFFTQPELIDLYKGYISHMLNRVNNYTGIAYKDDATFFAWELMNEPRCLSYTDIKSQNCTTATMTAWIDDISTYIKSIAPNTMVTIGDEGWFNNPSLVDNWLYDGFNGIDFEANLQLKNIDFGTFHTYPDHGWGAGTTSYDLSFEWGEQWIRQHRTIGAQVGKPVINEEYGFAQRTDRMSFEQYYYSVTEDIGIAGDLFWSFWIAPPDGSPIAENNSPNSTYTPGLNYYVNDTDWPIIRQHIYNMAQQNLPVGEGDFSCFGARNIFCSETVA